MLLAMSQAAASARLVRPVLQPEGLGAWRDQQEPFTGEVNASPSTSTACRGAVVRETSPVLPCQSMATASPSVLGTSHALVHRCDSPRRARWQRLVGRSINWASCSIDVPPEHGIDAVRITLGFGTRCYVAGEGSTDTLCYVRAGEARWIAAHREFIVRPGACLVLAPGTERTLVVDAMTRVKTVEIALPPSVPQREESAKRSRVAGSATGIPEPGAAAWAGLPGLWPTEGLFGVALDRVATAVEGGIISSTIDQPLEDIVSSLQRVARSCQAACERIPATKLSTRLEILRRVTAGRDHIESHLLASLALGNIAKAAAMSPFHFHRAFVRVFRETPREYIVRRRLSIATTLLAVSDLPVTEIALRSGFGSNSAFGAAFRRCLRTSPAAFRRSRKGAISGIASADAPDACGLRSEAPHSEADTAWC